MKENKRCLKCGKEIIDLGWRSRGRCICGFNYSLGIGGGDWMGYWYKNSRFGDWHKVPTGCLGIFSSEEVQKNPNKLA